MTPHKILKSFKGSHDGINTRHFESGTVEPLSDSLAAIVVKEGWAVPHTETQSAPDNRETKVVEAPEVKDEEPKKNGKKAKA